MEIPTLKLNAGADIPSIGFGTWQLAEGDEVINSVSEALKVGYRLIDTAKLYANEYGVGKAVRDSGIPREEIFLTTKLWSNDLGYESAFEAFDESLRNLQTDYIDLYLIHWPASELRHDAWRALEQIYSQGRAKAVGVSNYDVRHLEELLDNSGLVPAVNQIEFHPFIYGKQAPILEFCEAHDIVVEAYSPLARAHNLDNGLIMEIAHRIGKSSAQVMLRWAIQRGTVPIPRSSNPARIKENFQVFDFELSKEDMKAIDGLSSGRSVLS